MESFINKLNEQIIELDAELTNSKSQRRKKGNNDEVDKINEYKSQHRFFISHLEDVREFLKY